MADTLHTAVAQIVTGEDAILPLPFHDADHARMNLRASYSALGASENSIEILTEAVRLAAESPDPNGALNNLERYIASDEAAARIMQEHPAFLKTAITVFSHSQYLSDVLIREPILLEWLNRADVLQKPRMRPDYYSEVQAAQLNATDNTERKNALCRLKRCEYLRIGARDFLRLSNVEETTREISDLAEALIAAASEIAWEQTVGRYGPPRSEGGANAQQLCGMCVLGMGKLGGRELNFASDIDLIFIYDSEGETTGELPNGRKVAPQTNHEFFTKMGEAIIRFLSERGAEGNLFRVDMRLRPEGNTGPLARSLESFSNYLSQQARDWERLAYLKSRVLAGPTPLANRIYEFTEQFAFSDAAPQRIIQEVERLKFMIDREVINSDAYHREVKRGYGGIREIEFVVATMQIVYGRVHRALHVRNIFVGIQRLQQVSLLTPEEAHMYFKAYDFLRMVEHRLQMADERQTHTISEDPHELEKLARRCGYPDANLFLITYRAVTEQVHNRFVKFFEQDVTEIDRKTEDALIILNRDASQDEALAALERFGLHEPSALPLIRDLAFGTREVFITAEGQRSFEQMLPSLLRLIPEAPNPAQVLPLLHSFVLTVKGITYYYELIAEHPDILRLIVLLFGTSEHYSRALITHPEFFDALISSQVLYEEQTKETVLLRLSTAVNSRRQLDRRLVMLRRAVTFEMLLSALRYILKLQPTDRVLSELATTADASVEIGMQLAAQRMADRASNGDAKVAAEMAKQLFSLLQANLLIVALGKYGGGELGFFGDADVVFVFDDNASTVLELGQPMSVQEFYQSAADSLQHVLGDQLEEGRVLVIDARLRPHGKNSPIATASSIYENYLANNAEVWELQSFTRARAVFGPASLLAQLKAAAHTRTQTLKPEQILTDMQSMRARLEIAQSGTAGMDFKRAVGGLVDIEFALQYLELSGTLKNDCRTANYFDMLKCVLAQSPVSREALQNLNDGYVFLRTLESAARLVTGKGESVLPQSGISRHAVAVVMGFSSADAMLDQVTSYRERIRSAYLEIMESA